MSKINGMELLKARLRDPRVITSAILGGGGSVLFFAWLRQQLKRLSTERTKPYYPDGSPRTKGSGISNTLTWRRFKILVRIMFPSWKSNSTIYFIILNVLLIARTTLSGLITEVMGRAAQQFVTKKWRRALGVISSFLLLTIPAAFVNSGLRYYTMLLSLQFRLNLSYYIHQLYLKENSFYVTCNIKPTKIDSVDQKINADVKAFCNKLTGIYPAIIKPVLDSFVFSILLGRLTGWKGPTILYLYFAFSAFMKRYLMPAYGGLAEREARLEGLYANLHKRLLENSEEISLYNSEVRENIALNNRVAVIKHDAGYIMRARASVAVIDNILVKYLSTIAGYMAMSCQLIGRPSSKSIDELTRDYTRQSRYVTVLYESWGLLTAIPKKFSELKGYINCVTELIERLDSVKIPEAFPMLPKPIEYSEGLNSQFLKGWRIRCDMRVKEPLYSEKEVSNVRILTGDHVEMSHIHIVAPDGHLLVKDLSFKIHKEQNLFISGPRNSGKSSIFRILGDLWPPNAASDSSYIIRPTKEDIFYTSHRPYLVLGTLRDQIIYPHTRYEMSKAGVSDEDLCQLLKLVDSNQTILSTYRLDQEMDWIHVLTPNQQQRLAIARMFYHRPVFAVLDECTDMLTDQVEEKIYEVCQLLGITVFTVSDRFYLREWHDFELKMEGRDGKWTFGALNKKFMSEEESVTNDL